MTSVNRNVASSRITLRSQTFSNSPNCGNENTIKSGGKNTIDMDFRKS